MQNLPQTFVYEKECIHLEVEGESKVVCYDAVLLILHSLDVLKSKVFVCYSVAIFISPMPSVFPCTAASITDPHFTSCTRLTTYIHFLQHVNVRSTPCPPHLTSPSHTHPQSAKNVFFPPPHPSLPITNHTSYRIITQLLRAYHLPASAPHPRLRNVN